MRVARALGSGAVLVGAVALGGCAGLGFGGGSSQVRFLSNSAAAALEPRFTTQVYHSTDPNTADIYLTDLNVDDLIDYGGSPGGPAGNVLHIHMFLYPKAGRTPIDFTASNCTITHVVVVGDAVGVYGGGGFLLPSGKPGRARFGGRIKDASMRLMSSTPNFDDRLGANEMSGSVGADRDEQKARDIGAWTARVVRSMQER